MQAKALFYWDGKYLTQLAPGAPEIGPNNIDPPDWRGLSIGYAPNGGGWCWRPLTPFEIKRYCRVRVKVVAYDGVPIKKAPARVKRKPKAKPAKPNWSPEAKAAAQQRMREYWAARKKDTAR